VERLGDYPIVPLFDGTLVIESANGERSISELRHGVPYLRSAGVEHDAISGNDFACAFIETELLQATD